ncbi:InlB B-repeat-containing protein [Bifidobacterium olomucense]|uniref:Alpha-amylase n=1 Tax=Bifidobacterium olomucense TaxID=2675324 RepID=A0A7Y0EYA6_9BIFI|nr:InlB B-repeat-containing protein [Bifidobacterium sp. DSM 109959]NMM98635.1 Listeria-Bacteroides repeat domain [Bifidobacterium sp. DSM 109959]
MTRNTALRGLAASRSAEKPAHLNRRARTTMSRSLRKGASKLFAVMLGAAMTLGGAVATTAAVADEIDANITQQAASKKASKTIDPTKAQSDVTMIAFQQSWNTIAKECKSTYGPEGVGYVQISPPEESVQGTQWWTVYQPISYSLNSRFGTEDELKNMITECNSVGVQIIADVVLNHTSGHDVSWVDDQYGVAGTAYNGTYGRYPGIGIYQYEESGNNHQYGLASGDFHSCRTNIADYTNADEVQDCRLSTMWDINTGSSRVQNIQAEYLAKLWNLGVRGFRIDSAKHIDTLDLKAIKAKLAQKIGMKAADIPFQQEVIYHQGESELLATKHYTANGDVTEFSYSYQLRQYFNGDISNLKNISNGLLPSDKATVFVTNWDTARGSETLTVDSGSRYELANAFMLAYDYGKPKLISDYYFTDGNSDAGPTGTTDTHVTDVDFDEACKTSGTREQGQWLCEQRWASVRGMIGFHNAVAGTTVGNWQHNGANNIGFARQDANGKDQGFIAINNTLQEHQETYQTSLPNGEYCDVYTSGKTCNKVTVKDGKLSVTIAKRSAVAIYAAADKPDNWVGYETADTGYDDQANTDRIGDGSATIYYKPRADWGNDVYIQYAIGDTLLNGKPVKMEKVSGDGADCDAAAGWYKTTIPDATTKRLKYRFTNDPNGADGALWDYHDGYSDEGGSKLYENAVGTAITAVENHDETIGVPFVCVASAKTTFTVHFKATTDAQKKATGVVVWGTDVNGNALGKTYHAFDKTSDSYGKRMTTTLGGDFTTVNYRIVAAEDGSVDADAVAGTNDSYAASVIDKQEGSVVAKVRGSIEAWADGSDGKSYDSSEESRNPASVPTPNDVKNPKQLNVIVHYMRVDGNYQEYDLDTDAWKGWDLWMWSGEQSGSPVSFTEHDDYGMIARYTLNQPTKGNRTPEFVLRQGGDSWMSKDPDGNDRLIPESAIQVAAGQNETGTAEIWLVSGDPTIYTYRPSVLGVTFETGFDWNVSPQAVVYGGTVRPIADNQVPKREGYILTGWATDADGNDPFTIGEGGTPVTERLKLYAQYEKANVVTFDAGSDAGFDWRIDSQTVRTGGTVSAPASNQNPDGHRDGYKLLGWSTTKGNKVADFQFDDGNGGGTQITGDTTLYAVWQKLTYTVTFETGEGGSDVAPQTVEYGDAVSVPTPAPTCTGYDFVSWVTDVAEDGTPGNTPYVFGTPVTGNLTLYAKWTQKGTTVHLVTLHHNDGTDAVDTTYVEDGISMPSPEMTRDGYRLAGWSTKADGLDDLYDFSSQPVAGDLTLYAQWVKVWKVAFDLNYEDAPAAGETGSVPTQTVDDGADAYATEPSPEPTREGYTFDGWYRDADLTTKFVFKDDADDQPTLVTADITLYAKWVKEGTKRTITFQPNGGSLGEGMPSTQQVPDGEYLTKPKKNPTRTGYTFQGWTTVKNDAFASNKNGTFSGGSAFGFDAYGKSLIPIDRDGTLYALWSKD